MRGRKPKPTELKLVLGNPGKRPIPTSEPMPSGPLGRRPGYLRGRATELWSEIAELAFWLGDADSYKLGNFCSLMAEFEAETAKFSASRINVLSALGSDLGLDPAARARLVAG